MLYVLHSAYTSRSVGRAGRVSSNSNETEGWNGVFSNVYTLGVPAYVREYDHINNVWYTGTPYYTPTCCTVGALGRRPRQFSGLSDYSQLLIVGKVFFPDRALDCFFSPFFLFFFLFLFLKLLLLRTPRSESTNQAPIAAVSTHRKHSKTARSRPDTEQQSTCSSTTFVSTQTAECMPTQSATTQAGRH